jgi:hypothetical protein
MYALVWEGGHVVWKKQWYALMSRISLWTNFYITWEDHVFIANAVVTNLTRKKLVSNVINQPTGAIIEFNAIIKIQIKCFMKGTTLFRWPWKCMPHLGVIRIVSSKNVPIFFHNRRLGDHLSLSFGIQLFRQWRAPKSRGETHLRVSQNQVAESWDLVARSRLPTLERGRGSSWEPKD